MGEAPAEMGAGMSQKAEQAPQVLRGPASDTIVVSNQYLFKMITDFTVAQVLIAIDQMHFQKLNSIP